MTSFENTYQWKENEEDFELEDEDTCSAEELDILFKHRYRIHDQPKVTYDDSYVLALTKDESFECVVAGLSDGSVRVFDVNSEKGIYIESPILENVVGICGVRFMDETPNLLLVGTTNGLVRLLDLRAKNEVKRFVLDNQKEIISFDRNSRSRLLAMGTSKFRENGKIMFFDIRKCRVAFLYSVSHEDDVTSVRFHPENSRILCTGSTDCLINIFDISASREDDGAILTTVNIGDTVRKVNWHKNSQGRDVISCITDTNCFKAYDFDGGLLMDFDRLKITEAIKRKNEANCNLIDCHSTADNRLVLLTGSNTNNGSILRSCDIQNDRLVPYANLKGNEQIVRESIFDAKRNIFVTGGENGFVTLWTPLPRAVQTSTIATSCTLKMTNKTSNKVTPY